MSALGKAVQVYEAVSGKARQVAQAGRAISRTIGAKKGLAAAGGAAAAAAAAGGAGYLMGDGVEYRVRRRSRGISAKEFKTTQRTMKKIIKMYNKLPKRSAKSSSCAPTRGGKVC